MTTTATPPTIHEATLGGNGAVIKGAIIDLAQAEAVRRRGGEVVVCGLALAANRQLAALIERNANGVTKRCIPHEIAGAYALPHFQPKLRPPKGHTFYETAPRRAF